MKIPTATRPPACGSAADRRNDTPPFRPGGPIVNAPPKKDRFDIAEDVDWFAWPSVVAGVTYTIQTRDLAPGVDTVLTVLDGSRQPVASDDNSGGGKASRLEWQAPSDGWYSIRVDPAPGSAYGCEAWYSLEVTAPPVTLTLHNSGQIKYIDDNGDWVTYTHPAVVLTPGQRYFSFN